MINNQSVAIIGSGFTGLSAALRLSKAGVDVTVFELGDTRGGLAGGFMSDGWQWSLEHHYHHLFTNDNTILNLAKDVGQKVVVGSPKSSTYFHDGIYRFDSPITLLNFSKLSFFDRLRTGAVMGFLKANLFWKPFEKVTSEKFIRYTMGESSWKLIWEPLFVKKFGKYSGEINAAWFWARIYKRTMKLAYPEGGFVSLAGKIEKEIIKNGGKFFYNTGVTLLKNKGGKIAVVADGKAQTFDKVICTVPTNKFIEITNDLPKGYIDKISKLKGLGAINLVLSLKNEFLPKGAYWLNVNELSYPFLAVIEHTNFMDKKYYNNEHLVYVANYLPTDHKYYSFSEKELLKEYFPYLKKINKDFNKEMINKAWVFKDKFAQPVVFKNHSKNITGFKTPIEGLYLCNMEQVYPWDRGTNYAVEYGEKVAELVLKSYN